MEEMLIVTLFIYYVFGVWFFLTDKDFKPSGSAVKKTCATINSFLWPFTICGLGLLLPFYKTFEKKR